MLTDVHDWPPPSATCADARRAAVGERLRTVVKGTTFETGLLGPRSLTASPGRQWPDFQRATGSMRSSQRLLIPAPAFPGRGRRDAGGWPRAGPGPGQRLDYLRLPGSPLGVVRGVVTVDDEVGRASAARLI